MKQRILLLATLLLAACSNSQNDSNSLASGKTTRQVIVMHPTVNNLKTLLYLTKNAIFPLPKDYRVVGVYDAREVYDYKKSQKFIEDEGLTNVSLLKVKSTISADSLYVTNSSTAIFTQLFNESRGVIFLGGPDMPPATYGDSTNLLTEVTDPYRHYLELSFMFHLLGGNQNATFKPLMAGRPDFRVLGICLGMQTMNVATGGTLYQDIPTELYGQTTVEQVLAADRNGQHRNYHTNLTADTALIWGSFHQIALAGGTKMKRISLALEAAPFVLSSHHQCVKQLGKGLMAAAWSMDGRVVEAIEHVRFPNVVGVQFHPEPSILYQPARKLQFESGKPAESSFIDLYPGDKGEAFHREFWGLMGEMYK